MKECVSTKSSSPNKVCFNFFLIIAVFTVHNCKKTRASLLSISCVVLSSEASMLDIQGTMDKIHERVYGGGWSAHFSDDKKTNNLAYSHLTAIPGYYVKFDVHPNALKNISFLNKCVKSNEFPFKRYQWQMSRLSKLTLQRTYDRY